MLIFQTLVVGDRYSGKCNEDWTVVGRDDDGCKRGYEGDDIDHLLGPLLYAGGEERQKIGEEDVERVLYE